MKIPTKSDIGNYLTANKPLGFNDWHIGQNLTPKANNHWNWMISSKGKKYVFRIAKPKRNIVANIPLEYLVLDYLRDTNFAPFPYWLDTEHFTYPLLIEDFIKGKKPSETPNISELKLIARSVAYLHRAAIPEHIPLDDRRYAQRFAVLEGRLRTAVEKTLIKKAAKQIGIFSLMPRIKEFFRLATSLADKKSQVFLHGDLYLGNVIIKRDKAILIDFQKPAVGEPTFDFGNIFVDISWRPYYENHELRNAFLKEYNRINPYPNLPALFDIRMIERDITSIISKFRDAAGKLPQTRSAIQKYFLYERLEWRIELVKVGLDRVGV